MLDKCHLKSMLIYWKIWCILICSNFLNMFRINIDVPELPEPSAAWEYGGCCHTNWNFLHASLAWKEWKARKWNSRAKRTVKEKVCLCDISSKHCQNITGFDCNTFSCIYEFLDLENEEILQRNHLYLKQQFFLYLVRMITGVT